MILAGIILGLTLIGIAFPRLPKINIDRPAAAMAGAVLMVLVGALTFRQAVAAINFDTIALLLGMMLLVVVLQRAGLFTLMAQRAVTLANSPGKLLMSVVIVTAVASAFLVNDVVVLLFTPVVIQACRMQRLNPVPYLIGEAMASNIGSTATIVGNPQNALIGIASGISFARFFAYLAPVAVVSTALLFIVLWAFYRKGLRRTGNTVGSPATVAPATPVNRGMLLRTAPVLAGVVVALFVSSLAGFSIPMVALTAGAAAMLLSGVKPSEIIRDVDWVLLLFFAGLFIVVEGAHQSGLLAPVFDRVDLRATAGGIASIHAVSAVASQIVSNVPLTVLLLPLLERVPGDALWIALAAGATLAGNATLIGAVANIIVAEQASRQGIDLRFGEFLRVGVVVTALTMAASVGIFSLEMATGFLR